MKHIKFDGAKIAPSKIICIGRNYVAHIAELGNDVPEHMVVFAKPNSAIGDTLYSTLGEEAIHYEGEIALLVEGGEFTAAGFGLDLTKRELQGKLKRKGLPWERAKAFDGAALFSDFVSIDKNGLASLSLSLDVDGNERQTGGVGLMMYPPAVIQAELQQFITLEDGDIVMTGTPAGVGEVSKGQRFAGSVFQDGTLLTGATWTAR
jgi:2-keto-4-pentenoate hydratase/2-oxohepta-3-ene-1,7-dioic acid hydratase in catechol pathway